MGELKRSGVRRPALLLAVAFVGWLFAARVSAAEPAPPTAGFPAPASEPAAVPGAPPPAPAAAPAPAPAPAPAAPASGGHSAPGAAVSPPPALPPAPEFPLREPEPRNVSLTLSPLRLLTPMIEVGLEVRVGSFGVTLFGGAGRIAIDGGELDGERLAAYELGGIVNAYPLEKFESLSLGAELLWLKVNADDIGEDQIDGVASGVAVGPLIGYKTIGATGFTFSIQGGVAYIVLRAEASNAFDEHEEEEDETWVPLVNLNLGWSF